MSRNKKVVRKQPRKDSKAKRINLDNARESKVEADVIKDISETKCSNDVRWYANNPELLRSAASLPFSSVTGANTGFSFDGTVNQAYATVPGVMQLRFLPTIGGWDDSAINSAKNSVYSYVVHANSRNTSYNSTDLMMIILAGANIFTAIASAIRAYGTMRLFDQRNKYLPKGLVRAMGFDYDDLRANLSLMWFDINELIARSSQIWIPNTMPFLDRWFWMNSYVYQDSESVKGQYYVFAQAGFLGYNETQTEQGGGLSWIQPDGQFIETATNPTTGLRADPTTSPLTWSQFMTVVNAMFDDLLDSEDRGVMMGDMLKAYGADKIYALKPIPVDYQVIPVYDREVLSQIENADRYTAVYYQIVQNQSTLDIATNWGVASPSGVLLTGREHATKGILNFHQKENPSPEQIMVATRLKCLGTHYTLSSDGTTISNAIPDTMGTEYIVGIQVVYFNVNGTLLTANYNTVGFSDLTAYFELAFDWAPWVYLVQNTGIKQGDPSSSAGDGPKVLAAYGDYDYYTVIDQETLKKMHTTAVYSEFGVPTL